MTRRTLRLDPDDIQVENCVRKRVFATKDTARAAAKRINRNRDWPVKVKVYRCPVCRLYHHTKKKETGQ